jgi:hypothetical protein
MKSFNKKLKDYLTFYKTPIAPDQLDPTLFYFPETGEEPRLQQGIHAHILNDMEMFCSNQPARIKTAAIVGDAVTPGKPNRMGEVEVVIVLNKDIMDLDVDGLLAEDILKLAASLSKRVIVGTTRTIRYIVSLRSLNPEDHQGIYDIPQQKWTKLPSGLR